MKKKKLEKILKFHITKFADFERRTSVLEKELTRIEIAKKSNWNKITPEKMNQIEKINKTGIIDPIKDDFLDWLKEYRDVCEKSEVEGSNIKYDVFDFIIEKYENDF